MGDDIAFIQLCNAGFFCLWLAQDPAYELRHSRSAGAGSERAQHVCKRAVPALLQGLFGDDDSDAVGRTEQVLIFRLAEIIPGRSLYRDFGLIQSSGSG
ncbi:MAG: hypothetical protein M2R46_05493 [Verrucomicrobia subdivision 3 bacterium]|nr:hypothetical protein [Limisphaerales bacterium]